MNPKRTTTRHIVIKIAKVKYNETILKEARGKHRITYKGNTITLSADFSATLPARGSSRTSLKCRKKPTT